MDGFTAGLKSLRLLFPGTHTPSKPRLQLACVDTNG